MTTEQRRVVVKHITRKMESFNQKKAEGNKRAAELKHAEIVGMLTIAADCGCSFCAAMDKSGQFVALEENARMVYVAERRSRK